MKYWVLIVVLFCHSAWASVDQLNALPFDIQKNRIEVLKTRLSFEVHPRGDVTISDIAFTDKTFSFHKVNSQKWELTWPKGIFEKVRVTVRNIKGKVIQTEKVREDDLRTDTFGQTQTVSAQFPLKDWNLQKMIDSREVIFCLQEQKKSLTLICTQKYAVQPVEGGWAEFSPMNQAGKSGVVFDGTKQKKRATIVVTEDEPHTLDVRGVYGTRLVGQFLLKPRNYVDIRINKEDELIVSYLPFGSKELKTDTLPRAEPRLMRWRPGQVPLFQEVYTELSIPGEDDDVRYLGINKTRVYASTARLRMRKPASGADVVAIDGVIQDLGGGKFEWQVRDLKRDLTQRRYLSVKDEESGKTLYAYADMTRHRSMSLSTHWGYLPVSGSENAVDGNEVLNIFRFSWWLDDLFRFRIPGFTWQRWGYDFEMFNALLSETVPSLLLVHSTVKYRFNEGIIHHNNSYGLRLGFQYISEGGVIFSGLGAGLFASIQSPQFVKNLMSFGRFRKTVPQWIELDYTNYFLPMDTNTTANSSYIASIKYKHQWESFFETELGFYIKEDDLTRSNGDVYNSQFTVVTLGAGIRF